MFIGKSSKVRSNHSPTWSYKPIRGMRVQEPNWTWTSSDAVSRGGSSGREVTGESEAQSQVTAWEVQFTPKSTKKPEEPFTPSTVWLQRTSMPTVYLGSITISRHCSLYSLSRAKPTKAVQPQPRKQSGLLGFS